MEEVLSKIFDRIVIYEKDCISLGTEFDQKVAEKLEPMKGTISERILFIRRIGNRT